MGANLSILAIGAGVFGLSSAVELARRGHSVTLMDPGPIPHPRAASTDISKAVRMDYGSDELYMSLMEEAFEIWDQWNRERTQALYHEDGFLVLSPAEMRPGSFEYESFQMLQKRGHSAERLSSKTLRSRFPAWNAEKYGDGYFNPRAGWAATGTWSPLLSNRLSTVISQVAQPIFYFRPKNVDLYKAHVFPVWAADLSHTGWYGFPVTRDGTVKVSNHGPGRKVHPDDNRETVTGDEVRCRKFLGDNLPSLAEAPLASSRTCLYCDSWDGNFYIDHDPELPGLVYATGGSGHAFKFAPVLGRIVADVVELKPNPYSSRFAWREPTAQPVKEQARFKG